MILERVRLLDIAWSWARGTHRTYQTQFNFIRKFEAAFTVSVLASSFPSAPPSSPDIALAWCMEHRALHQVRALSRGCCPGPVSFSTIRQLRSAAAQYYQLSALITHPSASHINKEGCLLYQGCRPTDNLTMRMRASGLSRRLGTDVFPSKALLARHVHSLDDILRRGLTGPSAPSVKLLFPRAGFANCVLWLGWLRSAETFCLCHDDIVVTLPQDAATRDLPRNVGMLELLLLPETKSAPSLRADVIIAASTASGLDPLWWYQLICDLTPARQGSDFIFCDESGSQWTSAFFRSRFLFPCLRHLQANGDLYLRDIDISSSFWSLHCYRRGARTHVDKVAFTGIRRRFRRSIASMVYEHGRWTL